jgi:hypothetical protein
MYEKSRTKRNSFLSHLGFGKSNRKTHTSIDTSSSQFREGADSPAQQMFKNAHDVEVKQSLVVDGLAAKVEECKRRVSHWHCRLIMLYSRRTITTETDFKRHRI